MKTTLIFAVFLFLTACGRDLDILRYPDNSFVSTRDGYDWTGDVELRLIEGDTLQFWAIAGDGYVFMATKFVGVGNYTVGKRDASYSVLMSGDVLVASYEPENDADINLELTSYDPATRHLEGRFALLAKQNWPKNTTGVFDMKNGRFKGTIVPFPPNPD